MCITMRQRTLLIGILLVMAIIFTMANCKSTTKKPQPKKQVTKPSPSPSNKQVTEPMTTEAPEDENKNETDSGTNTGKKKRFFGHIIKAASKVFDAAASTANIILKPTGLQIPNSNQLFKMMNSVISAFIPEWNPRGPDYIIAGEATFEYYCQRFGLLHVLCACQGERKGLYFYERGVDPLEFNVILGYFNSIRQGLLQGALSVVWGNLRALEMCLLGWSQELQLLAQGIANQGYPALNRSLVYSTDKYLKVSVSIAATSGVYQRHGNNNPWNDAFRQWYLNQVENVPQDAVYYPNRHIDDFSNIVWADTFQVGCGYASFSTQRNGPRTNIFVCAFGPGGNIPGSKMFVDRLGTHVTHLEPPPTKKRFLGIKVGINIGISLTTTNPFRVPPPAYCWNGYTGLPYHPFCICPILPDPNIPTTPTTPKPIIPTTAPPVKPITFKPTTMPPKTKAPHPVTPPPTPKPDKHPTTKAPKEPLLPPRSDCKEEELKFDDSTRKFILLQPFMVFFTYEPLQCHDRKKALKCSGFIYNSQWIVTSFHCALPTLLRSKGQASHYPAVVHYGQSILNSTSSKEHYRTVIDGIVPEDVNIDKRDLLDNINSNIALLKIDSKILFSKYSLPIRLVQDKEYYQDKTVSMFYGWTVKEGKVIEISPTKIKTNLLGDEQSKKEFKSFDVESRFSSRPSPESRVQASGHTDIGGPLVTVIFTDSNQAPVPSAEAVVFGVLPVSMSQRIKTKVDNKQKVEYYTTITNWVTWIAKVAGEQDVDWNAY